MSWEPKFSRKTGREYNCGQHCIAMITHHSVDLVCQNVGHRKGTSAKVVAFTLWSMGRENDGTMVKYRSGMPLPDLCILRTQNHWCLYFRGKIYCSDLGIYTKDEYLKRFRCRIAEYLKVEVPNG